MKDNISISICICTSGRPVELIRCLESIKAGTRLPDEVIVSDDSREPATAEQIKSICGNFPFVRYVDGPRSGLCANRNHVVRQSRGSHLSLLDDDAVVQPDFVAGALAAVAENEGDILTGDVFEDGIERKPPSNPTFLGHFGRRVEVGDQLANVHLNCNVFPRSAFAVAAFDERISYGYEDTDLCSQLLRAGYTIRHVEGMSNLHLPPTRNTYLLENDRLHPTERARLYTTLKRYFHWQRRPLMGLIYLTIGPAHLFLAGLRRRGVSSILPSAKDVAWAVRELFAFLRSGESKMPCVCKEGP